MQLNRLTYATKSSHKRKFVEPHRLTTSSHSRQFVELHRLTNATISSHICNLIVSQTRVRRIVSQTQLERPGTEIVSQTQLTSSRTNATVELSSHNRNHEFPQHVDVRPCPGRGPRALDLAINIVWSRLERMCMNLRTFSLHT
jgi:hypothetical protein